MGNDTITGKFRHSKLVAGIRTRPQDFQKKTTTFRDNPFCCEATKAQLGESVKIVVILLKTMSVPWFTWRHPVGTGLVQSIVNENAVRVRGKAMSLHQKCPTSGGKS
jgi:hypothetical protein